MVQAARILLIDAESVAPEVTRVNLRGRLDATGVQAVEATFARVAQTQEHLIVDLSRVSFIASAGLRTLIAGARAMARRGGRMVFLQPEPSVEAVLITSGADQVIPISQTLSDAICAVCMGEGGDDELTMKALTFSLETERKATGVARVGAWVDELCILLNLNQRTEYALRLCLEEAVTDIVEHGTPLPGGNDDKIGLRLVADLRQLSVIITDRCARHNPLEERPERSGADSAGDAGLRLGLMRQHAREMSWSRVGSTNRLALTISR